MSFDWLATPPVALLLFIALGGALHWWAGRRAARGQDSPGKHLPYACGEDLVPDEAEQSYQSFFRLGLVFVIVHIVTLVIATLSREIEIRALATAFLIGVAICVDVLTT
jgi:NADH:ubiquinone oxidoreductase subunit 3 (subunit A)